MKYIPHVITDEFLEEIIEAKPFAIQYVPEERMNDNIAWIVVRTKEPRCLFGNVPIEKINEEMEYEIIDTYTYTGIKYYISRMRSKLTIDKIIRILDRNEFTNKMYKRRYLRDNIPTRLLTDEILNILNK